MTLAHRGSGLLSKTERETQLFKMVNLAPKHNGYRSLSLALRRRASVDIMEVKVSPHSRSDQRNEGQQLLEDSRVM